MKVRKKPITVEAWRIPKDSEEDTAEIPKWVIEGMMTGKIQLIDEDKKVTIVTLEGPLQANQGDYVMKGVKGELYPCAADIFAMSYDIVD